MDIVNIKKEKLLEFLLKTLEKNYNHGLYTYQEYNNMVFFVSMFIEILEQNDVVNFFDLLIKNDLGHIIIKDIEEKKPKSLLIFFNKALNIDLNNNFKKELTKGIASVNYGKYISIYHMFLKNLGLKDSDLFNDYQRIIYYHYQRNTLFIIKHFCKKNDINYLQPSEYEMQLIILNFQN